MVFLLIFNCLLELLKDLVLDNMETLESKRRDAFQDALCRLIDQYSDEFEMSIGDITNALRQEEFRLMANLHRLIQRTEK